MTLSELIDMAVERKGSRRAVAAGMHQSPNRLTDWKGGSRKPDAHEIAYLAETAGLPVLETVAEIESQLDERYAAIWRAALGKLRAAGVAAGLVMIVGASPDANALAHQHAKHGSTVYYVNFVSLAKRAARKLLFWILTARIKPQA